MGTFILTPPGEMALSLRERKARQTRRHIINGAMELFVARGFEEVTIEDIAAACDLSRGTVFNYFSHKEGIVLEFADACMRDQLRALWLGLERGEDPSDLIWRALALPGKTVALWPPLFRIVMRELLHYDRSRAETAERQVPYLPLVIAIIAAGQKAGKFRAENSAESLGLFLAETTLASLARNQGRLSKAGLKGLMAKRQEVLMHGILA
jgi:AcrR family transcriptional regulator